jgi:hypothetical protein
LRNYALQNQKKRIVRNYVTTRATRKVVVAYYSLVYAAIDQKRLPAKLVKGLGKTKPRPIFTVSAGSSRCGMTH